MRSVRIIFALTLAGVLVWFGIIPAWTHIATDFPSYYTASRLFIDRADLSNIYDDAWFQSRIRENGIAEQGKFTPFPPVTVFLLAPVAWTSPITALRIWTAVNLLLLAFCVVILSKITGKDLLWSSLLMLSTGLGLINNFRFGQMYLLVALLMMIGYRLLQRSHPGRAGLIVGTAAVFKYFPAIFLVPAFIRKDRRFIRAFIAACAAMFTAGVALLGTGVHRQYLLDVLPLHLGGSLGGETQDPFSFAYQSWDGLFRRLFVYHAVWNPRPLLDSGPLFIASKILVVCSVVILTVAALRKMQERQAELRPMDFIVISVAVFLLLPDTATYHILMLVLPVALFLGVSRMETEHWIVLGCFAAIGFLPYRILGSFDGRGILTVLAYPRLALLVVIFFTILRFIRRPLKPAASVL